MKVGLKVKIDLIFNREGPESLSRRLQRRFEKSGFMNKFSLCTTEINYSSNKKNVKVGLEGKKLILYSIEKALSVASTGPTDHSQGKATMQTNMQLDNLVIKLKRCI